MKEHLINLYNNWLRKELKSTISGKKNYLHFDQKINVKNRISFFKTFLLNSQNISQHSFYPFLKTEIEKYSFKCVEKRGIKKKIRDKTKLSRPICYASHFDSKIYSWYSNILDFYYENQCLKVHNIGNNVIAYRSINKKCNIHFADDVFQFIKSQEDCVAIAFDISSFFDNIDHEILKKQWKGLLGVDRLPKDHYQIYKSLTKYSFVNKTDIEELIKTNEINTFCARKRRLCSPEQFRTVVRKSKLIYKNSFKNTIKESKRFGKICGIPQGSPMSAVLSNIYMLDFDIQMQKLSQKINCFYRRYSDDIVIVCPIELETKVKETVHKEITKNELTINPSKTETVFFIRTHKKLRGYSTRDKKVFANFQYLGFEFNGSNTYIRSSSVAKYKRRLTSKIRESLKAAHGKKGYSDKLFKKKIYQRYSDKDKRNFISYARRAANEMESSSIQKQQGKFVSKIKDTIGKKRQEVEIRMIRKGKTLRKLEE